MKQLHFSNTLAGAYCLFMLVVLMLANLTGLYIFAPHLPDTPLTTRLHIASQDGSITALVVIFSACVSVLVCGLLIYLKTRSFTRTAQFFDLGRPTLRVLGKYLLILLAIMATSEFLMGYFDSTPLSFLDNLLTVQSFWWLMIAIVVVAPIYEEVVFRGLMFGVICSDTPSSAVWLVSREHFAIVVSGLLFALVHLQYDLLGMAVVLSLGILFGHARAKHGLLLAMLLHFFNNAITMVVYLFFKSTL